MALVHKTKGFVFKKEDKAEADRVFGVFTKDFGRINVSGRALRKIQSKLRGGIDIFYISDIEFIEGKHQKTLTDAVLVKKPDYKKYLVVQKIADLLESYLKGQEEDKNLFDEIERIMDILFKSDNPTKDYLTYQYFFWNFLSSQGYHFDVKACASCRVNLNPDTVYFSGKEGGVICKNCLVKDKSALKINSDVVKVLRIILGKNWEIILKLKISDSSKQILEHISLATWKLCAPVNI